MNIDYSGSLLPYIKTSLLAAKTLVDKLKPQDKMAIVTDDVELLVNFTNDKSLLKKKLDYIENRLSSKMVGKSQQYSALFATLNELFEKDDVRPIVIFQTDGDELYWLKGNPAPTDARLSQRNFSFEDIVTATEKTRVIIYTIIPGIRFIGLSESEQIKRGNIIYKMLNKYPRISGSQNQAKDVIDNWSMQYAKNMINFHLPMAELAKFTGGWTEFLEQPEQADEVYSRILAAMNSCYLVGYSPTNQMHDGQRRNVSIAVRDHPEYIIWGHKTYFPPESQQNLKFSK